MGGSVVSHSSARDPVGRRVLGTAPHRLDSRGVRGSGHHPVESQTPEKPFLFTSHLDQGRIGQAQFHRALLWPGVSLLSSATPAAFWLVHRDSTSLPDLHCYYHRRFSGP